MSAPRLRTAAMALGLGLVLAPALSGCIPSVDDVIGGLVQQGVQSGIEGATGVSYEVGGMPADFPGEVPLAEGEIVGGAAVNDDEDGKGWAVRLITERTQEDILAQLQAAGFSVPAEMGESGFVLPGVVAVENGRYMVTVMIGESDDGRQSANYVVIELER